MKRKLGAAVLVVLLILTVFALTKLDHAEALKAKQEQAVGASHGTY